MNDFDDLIEQELIEFQDALHSGKVSEISEIANNDSLPPDVEKRLNQGRDCLDFLNRIRRNLDPTVSLAEISNEEIPIPRQIDRFLVNEKLGSGGFGFVFRATDPTIDRDVAIKVPRPELLVSQSQVDRFRREAQAVAQLDHPNILSVYDSDDEGMTPYIVMPYIAGQDLAEWRTENSNIEPETAVQIVLQLARGVSHAHSRGVLHRDLKPANVLLETIQNSDTDSGLPFTPKLTDFGIAKVDDLNIEQTQTGAILGTISYMAPEQAEGRVREISAMSDIFSLGVMLYELLAETHPFRGETRLETLERIVRSDPPSLRNQPKNIPADLESIVFKCLEKIPERRYQSANELAADLQRFLGGEPVEARAIGPSLRLAKWCKRNPVTAAVALLSTVCVLAVVVIMLVYNAKLNSLLLIAEDAKTTALDRATALRKRACVNDVRLAQIAWDHGGNEQAISLLERHIPQTGESDVRHFAWWQLWKDYKQNSALLGQHPGGATAVVVNDVGNLAASAGIDGRVCLFQLPDGQFITELQSDETTPIESIEFHPDGNRLIAAGSDGLVRVFDVESHQRVLEFKAHEGSISDVVYSPDGSIIATGGADKIVRLWNSKTGQPVSEFREHEKRVRALAFHPSEPLLASTSLDGTIRLWNLETNKADDRIPAGMIQVPKHENWCRCLTFSPDGTSLVASSIMADLFQWSWTPNNYGILLKTIEQRPNARSLLWPPNSDLIFGDSTGRFIEWDFTKDEARGQSWLAHKTAITAFAFTPERKLLLSASEDETVRLWPAKTFPERLHLSSPKAKLPHEVSRLTYLDWTPRLLVTRADASRIVNNFIEPSLEQDSGVIDLFSLANGDKVHSIPIQLDERHSVSPSGKLILICHRDGAARCVSTASHSLVWQTQLPRFPHLEFYTTRYVIDQFDKHALVSWGKQLLMLSMQNGQVLHRLEHPSAVSGSIFVIQDRAPMTAISTCADGYLRVWNLMTGQLIREHRTHLKKSSISVAISNNQKLLAVGGSDGQAIVYQFPEMKQLTTFTHPDAVMQLAFFHNDEVLITRSVSTNFWSLSENLKLLSYPRTLHWILYNKTKNLWDYSWGPFAISPDGQTVAIANRDEVKLVHAKP